MVIMDFVIRHDGAIYYINQPHPKLDVRVGLNVFIPVLSPLTMVCRLRLRCRWW